MSLRKQLIKFTNCALMPLGMRVSRTKEDNFGMQAAVERIVKHSIPIRSVIDIGASDGKWSLETMRSFPQASFIAIEPLHERKAALDKLKKHRGNFDYELCVAGESNGTYATLHVSKDLDGSTVGGNGGELRNVPLRSIDAIVSERKSEGPHLLKFDTHGFEIPILNGATQTLKNTNVVIMEVYNFKITEYALYFHEMCSHMLSLGFRCYDVAGLMLRRYDKAFWQMDLFFCRNDLPLFGYSSYR